MTNLLKMCDILFLFFNIFELNLKNLILLQVYLTFIFIHNQSGNPSRWGSKNVLCALFKDARFIICSSYFHVLFWNHLVSRPQAILFQFFEYYFGKKNISIHIYTSINSTLHLYHYMRNVLLYLHFSYKRTRRRYTQIVQYCPTSKW